MQIWSCNFVAPRLVNVPILLDLESSIVSLSVSHLPCTEMTFHMGLPQATQAVGLLYILYKHLCTVFGGCRHLGEFIRSSGGNRQTSRLQNSLIRQEKREGCTHFCGMWYSLLTWEGQGTISGRGKAWLESQRISRSDAGSWDPGGWGGGFVTVWWWFSLCDDDSPSSSLPLLYRQ